MSDSPPTWADLYVQLPAEFHPYALKLAWDHQRLWAIDLPVEEMLVQELAWQLDLPWWRDDGRFFAVRPRDVLAHPERHREQCARTVVADLAFPIDVTLRDSRWFVLDGVHRLLKAVLLDLPTVSVRRLPPALLPLIASQSASNDLDFVRSVVSMLAHEDAHCWVFGDWAEELHGRAAPCEREDIDLLYLAPDFERVDRLIRERKLAKVTGKHFPHKRAFILGAIMVELLLVQHDRRGYFTEFWGETRHDWPVDVLSRVGGLPVASSTAVRRYRADYERLRTRTDSIAAMTA